jgi:hypothetical protein
MATISCQALQSLAQVPAAAPNPQISRDIRKKKQCETNIEQIQNNQKLIAV